MTLRDYQKDIIDQTINSNKSTLIQVPTGGGKTVIAKEIALELVNKHSLQVLFVAPKIILMEQTANVFKGLKPHIVHGVNEYDKDHHILISTIQTASRRDINPDVIFVDEIHYGFDGKMLQQLIKDKSDTRIIGLSATPYDKNGNQLEGFGLVLDKYDLKYMVENNFLVDIKSYVLTKIRKLDEVNVIGGDYNLKELSKIVSDNQTILEIVQSTAEYIIKYNKTIVFAVDINHAELLTQAYQHEGFSVKVLHSKMSKDDIDRNIRLFRENQIKILVSVLMLTTGFDVPDTDVAVIARPTKSQNLYKQMVGRVLRLADNKKHAVLLDCANVIENLGMPLDPIKVVQTNENGTNKQKCKDCGSENLSLKKDGNESYWQCKDCGHKKEIEQGAYECKMCNKLYTHDAKFDIKNDKLYLVCDHCPYPTLISEYSGDETFISLDNKLLDKYIKKFHLIIDKHLNNEKNMSRNNEYETYISSKMFAKKARNTGYIVTKKLSHDKEDQVLRKLFQKYIDEFISNITNQEASSHSEEVKKTTEVKKSDLEFLFLGSITKKSIQKYMYITLVTQYKIVYYRVNNDLEFLFSHDNNLNNSLTYNIFDSIENMNKTFTGKKLYILSSLYLNQFKNEFTDILDSDFEQLKPIDIAHSYFKFSFPSKFRNTDIDYCIDLLYSQEQEHQETYHSDETLVTLYRDFLKDGLSFDEYLDLYKKISNKKQRIKKKNKQL
jgi:superfamily II DNA or RNA helicase